MADENRPITDSNCGDNTINEICDIIVVSGSMFSPYNFQERLEKVGFTLSNLDDVSSADTYFRVLNQRGIMVVNLLGSVPIQNIRELSEDAGKYYDIIIVGTPRDEKICSMLKNRGLIDSYLIAESMKVEEIVSQIVTMAAATFMRNHNKTSEFESVKRNVRNSDQEGGLCGKKFLLIEDNVMAAEMTRDLIEFEGGDCTWALSVTAAEKDYANQDFDLSICDLMLPDLCGPEALHYLKTKILRPGTPILVVTSYAERELVESCTQVGICGYLVKPIEPENFVRRLSTLLDQFSEKSLDDKEGLQTRKKHSYSKSGDDKETLSSEDQDSNTQHQEDSSGEIVA